MLNERFRTLLCYDAGHTMMDGSRGVAKSEEIEIKLFEAPRIAGLPPHLTNIEYSPQVRVFTLRESADREREMYPAEIETLARWLTGLVAVWHAYRDQLKT